MGNHKQENYMFFKNLEQIMRQATMLYQMDHSMLDQILQQHDWADDHVSVAKENMDQVFDFIMNKTKEVPVPNNDMQTDSISNHLDFDFMASESAVVGFNDFIKVNEKKKLEWHDSDAPDANGKFKKLGIKALAEWLIKTRKGDMRKITGSLNQQINFNKKSDPAYAKKMEKVRDKVKNLLEKNKD
jgi:hypothetical protein